MAPWRKHHYRHPHLDINRRYSHCCNMLIEVKARKIGNSVGLIVPKEALARMHVQAGDRVFLTEAQEGGFRITPHNPEFAQQMQTADSIVRRYRNTLRELAK